MEVMNLLRRLSGVTAALAVLGATAFPLSVSACPAASGKAAQGCCCTRAGKPGCCRSCHCPKPPGALPGSGCTIQRTLPAGAVIPALALPSLDAAPLGILPAADLPASESLPRTGLFPRIEPGWDPGNRGFLVPLRI